MGFNHNLYFVLILFNVFSDSIFMIVLILNCVLQLIVRSLWCMNKFDLINVAGNVFV